MDSIRTAREQADGRAVEYQQPGPAVPRLLLGAHLRRLREVWGITREEAGAAIRASHAKISRLELGRTGCRQRDLADLLTLYGVPEGPERATLVALAKETTVPGWWYPYRDVIPNWMQAYLGLEQAASFIRGYEVQFVPGLLQTPDYARAVIRLGHGDASETYIGRCLELRMKRQQVLHRPQPVRLWVVIDEAALRRPIGSTATMRTQLRHLIDICDMPHITVQVMPFHSGGHAAAGGNVTLLRMPGDELPDTAYLEQLASAVYPNKPAEIEYYWDVMNRLVVEAEEPIATRRILHRILHES